MDASYALSEIPEHATSAHDVAFAPGFADPFSRHFDYADLLSDPVREDLPEAHRRAWARLARPGTWWTAAERLAIAAESRVATDCALCRKRKAALSPFTVDGKHDEAGRGALPEAAVDAVHRLVTDASRLTGAWVEGLAERGVSDGHYVELVSIVVSMRSIDGFHRAMGIDLEPLPDARPEAETGPPSRRRPDGVESGDAWVPLIVPAKVAPENRDLFPASRVPYVIRALSLVPDAVRWLKDLSHAHYLPMSGGAMLDFSRGRGPLSRAQTELIAGRVSAVNECFY